LKWLSITGEPRVRAHFGVAVRPCDGRGLLLAGSFEPRALQFVREWAAVRRSEIPANWERARRNEPLLGIDPLA
jgi:hypothetical protein